MQAGYITADVRQYLPTSHHRNPINGHLQIYLSHLLLLGERENIHLGRATPCVLAHGDARESIVWPCNVFWDLSPGRQGVDGPQLACVWNPAQRLKSHSFNKVKKTDTKEQR